MAQCLVALWHVKSSQTRDQTYVPCICRWILNHWTTGKVLYYEFYRQVVCGMMGATLVQLQLASNSISGRIYNFSMAHTFLSFLLKIMSEVKVAQSCPTLCDTMDHTVHGILQIRILEWVAFPFSKGSSQPRDRTQVSRIAGGFFTAEP